MAVVTDPDIINFTDTVRTLAERMYMLDRDLDAIVPYYTSVVAPLLSAAPDADVIEHHAETTHDLTVAQVEAAIAEIANVRTAVNSAMANLYAAMVRVNN